MLLWNRRGARLWGAGLSRLVVAIVLLSCPIGVRAQVTERQVEAGLGVLIPSLRAEAEVLVRSGNSGDWTLRRPGTNAWSCRVWTVNDRLVANCHHKVLAAFIDRNAVLRAGGMNSEEAFEQLGVDIREGRLVVPPASVEISSSGPMSANGIPESMSGFYFVYFPFATPEMLGVGVEDPGNGGAYLHYAGTAKAHLMWRRSHTP